MVALAGSHTVVKDAAWGLNSLFAVLLNPDGPLNVEAAERDVWNQDAVDGDIKGYARGNICYSWPLM